MSDKTLVPGAPTSCKACGSESLSWFAHSRNNSDVVEGRLRTGDVKCLFVLGCDECSETLHIASADSIAGLLGVREAPQQGDARAKFEIWAVDQGFHISRTMDGDGYQDLRTQGPWDAWQAATGKQQVGEVQGLDMADALALVDEEILSILNTQEYARSEGNDHLADQYDEIHLPRWANLRAALAATGKQQAGEVQGDAREVALGILADAYEQDGNDAAARSVRDGDLMYGAKIAVSAIMSALAARQPGAPLAWLIGDGSVVTDAQMKADRASMGPMFGYLCKPLYAREAAETDREQIAAEVSHVEGAVLIDGAVHLVQKGEELAWVRGRVDGRKAELLYAAPPAQGIDLGQKLVVSSPGEYESELQRQRDFAAGWNAYRAALIDQRDAAPGVGA